MENSQSLSLGSRMKGETIIKPIVYGNVAEYFGYKREEDNHTHKWSVYLRPYKEEELSLFIKKIHFKLHESYGANQNRILTEPPYEITETGWGEFEIAIKIFFIDPQEKPITIYHILKLFPPHSSHNTSIESNFSGIQLSNTDSKPSNVVSEFYDELVFQEPTTIMYKLLTKNKSEYLAIAKHATNFENKKEQVLQAINKAQSKINFEIKELNEKLKVNQEIMKNYHKEIENLEKISAS
ncbi:unnamed protein product [Gordionus sp. m RMFG-2023]|uniref:YEATS domain-containing protein 4-like n=1 Tax=Gordionus sp. m RMFG-2023 TaxID=3053472 RepID=UPI0030E5B394